MSTAVVGAVKLQPGVKAGPLELPPEDARAPLDLPPEGNEPPSLLAARPVPNAPPTAPGDSAIPPRASAPRATPFEPPLRSLGDSLLPEWLSEPLEPTARWATLLSIGLLALLAIEAFTVGRLLVFGFAARALFLVLLVVGSLALARVHRLGVAACVVTGTGLLLAAVLSKEFISALAFTSWTAALIVSARGRPTGLVVGALSLLVVAPCLLDGFTTRPLFGALLASLPSRPHPIEAPFVDQRSGLQLSNITSRLTRTEETAIGTSLADDALGYQLALLRLPSGLLPLAAREETERWLASRGLSAITWGTEAPAVGSFDTATLHSFSARRERQPIEGVLRVGHLGAEVFAIAAWARAHRLPPLSNELRSIVETASYRPPARPSLSTELRASVRRALVSVKGVTGVRVGVGARTVLLVDAAVPRSGVSCSSEAGPFDADFSKAAEAGPVLGLVLGGGTTVPSRSLRQAPRLFRVVVVTPELVAGGWLTDEPGQGERRVDLPRRLDGPAFDSQGNLVGLVREQVLTTIDVLAPMLTQLGGSSPDLASTTFDAPPPLYERAEPAVVASPQPALEQSVLQVKTSSGVTGAAVFGASESSWALVADLAIVPPGATSVGVRLPSGEILPATVGRSSGRAVLLVVPREASQALKVLPLIDGEATAGRRTAWGFRDEAIAGDTLRSIEGSLGSESFEPDPGPAPTSGPIVTSDGHLVALRVAGTERLVDRDTLSSLRLPAIKDVVWRVRVEPSGLCQLAIDAELDDPLGDARTLLLRLEPVSGDKPPPRLIAAAFADTKVTGPSVALTRQFDCFAEPKWMQFEVQSRAGTATTSVRRLRAPTAFPEIIRGRTGPSPGAARPSQSLTTQLWAIPSQVTHVHPCRARPELCERACAVEEPDACVLEARAALSKRDVGKAINRLDPACERGDLESCVLLAFALPDKRPKGLRSNPEAVLKPWCDAKVARACAALAAKEWRATNQSLSARCKAHPRDCSAAAEHALQGPRLDEDIERALKALRAACAAGDQLACSRASLEGLRLDADEPTRAMQRAERACAKNVADGCLLEAMNFALGITQPKTALGAEKALDRACQLGSAEACEMTW